MIKAPKELRQFAKGADQSTFDVADEVVFINLLYQTMIRGGLDKAEGLRRGRLVVSFLDEVLSSPYSDAELADMWNRSGAEFWFPVENIRTWLTLVRDNIDAINGQVEAGLFVALDHQGNPWPVQPYNHCVLAEPGLRGFDAVRR